MDEEITAYHEAGHAYAAIYAGARVRSVTIDPDRDDGLQRTGDTVVIWSRRRFSAQEMAEKAAWVALAGPVAEMLYREQPFHPGFVAEWAQDWHSALESLSFVTSTQHRLAQLEQYTIELYQSLARVDHWSAISAIADSLLAHETLEEQMILEVLEPWIPGR